MRGAVEVFGRDIYPVDPRIWPEPGALFFARRRVKNATSSAACSILIFLSTTSIACAYPVALDAVGLSRKPWSIHQSFFDEAVIKHVSCTLSDGLIKLGSFAPHTEMDRMLVVAGMPREDRRIGFSG